MRAPLRRCQGGKAALAHERSSDGLPAGTSGYPATDLHFWLTANR